VVISGSDRKNRLYEKIVFLVDLKTIWMTQIN